MTKNKSVIYGLLICVLLAGICLVVCRCTSIRSLYSELENRDQLTGEWHAENGNFAEYPLVSGTESYFRISEKETDDTDKWTAYAEQLGVSCDDLWSRRYAVMSHVYNENFPVVSAGGVQSGLKLRRDENGNIFSSATKLIPDSNLLFVLFDSEEVEILVAKDGNSLLIDGRVYSK